MSVIPQHDRAVCDAGRGRQLAWRAAGVAAAAGGPLFQGMDVARGVETVLSAATASMIVVALGVAGAVLVTLRSSRAIGRLLVWSAVTYSAGLGLDWWGGVSGSELAAWVAGWWWPLYVVPMSALLPLLFPDGELPSRRWRPIGWLAVASLLLLMVAAALEEPVPAALTMPAAPIRQTAGITGMVGAAALVVSSVAGIVSLLLRWRRGGPQVRSRLSPVVAVAILVAVVQVALPVLPSALSGTVLSLWPVLFVLAVSAGVWRHGLWDRTPVVRRATVSLVGTSAVIAVYAALVLLLGWALSDLPSWVTTTVAAAVVALCFEPARRWVRRWLDQRLYGDRLAPMAALGRLRGDLERLSPPDQVLDVAASTLARAMRSPGVHVVRRTPTGTVREGSFGEVPPQGSLRVPLVHGREDVGFIVAAPRGPRDPWSGPDRELLHHLAGEVARTVSLMNRQDDVVTLQAQIERLAQEQRAQLGRDLHDTLGPVLAGTSLSAQSLALRLDGSGVEADRAQQVVRGLQRATAEVRRMIEGLGSTVHDGASLVDAIQEHVGSLSGPDAPTFTVVADVGPLSREAAQGAYLIVLEAVTNVVRHAHATSAQVRVTSDEDRLLIEVADDGCGLGTYVAGVGMRSMRQRCAAVGGTCTLDPAPEGGTRVRASLPLAGGARR